MTEEDRSVEFECFDHNDERGRIYRFRAPRGRVDVNGHFVPWFLAGPLRCECGHRARIDPDTPFTRAEFVAMLDALQANNYLWEEEAWNDCRETNQFLAYARTLLDAVKP